MKDFVRQICPPILWRGLQTINGRLSSRSIKNPRVGEQDLDVYWDPRMAEMLEHWGEGNAWNEIQLLMVNRKGKALDIACGTGKTMSLLSPFSGLEVHGCDISDMLIAKALERGIPRDRLKVTDATNMEYSDGSFDWGYSIGSLEHFTEEGIGKFLGECSRVVRGATFHMVPVARSGRDEGWIKTFQSYHNNSVGWWENMCRRKYPAVHVLDSSWSDNISTGKWLVCMKQ
jgi:ubiquinone/menaquinone biosynthesis C-methylase UbiE